MGVGDGMDPLTSPAERPRKTRLWLRPPALAPSSPVILFLPAADAIRGSRSRYTSKNIRHETSVKQDAN